MFPPGMSNEAKIELLDALERGTREVLAVLQKASDSQPALALAILNHAAPLACAQVASQSDEAFADLVKLQRFYAEHFEETLRKAIFAGKLVGEL